MKNFKIVEGNSTLEFESTYPKIKNDIAKGMKIKDVRSKYNVTYGKWVKYRKKLVEDGIIKSKSEFLKDAKFYYWHKQQKNWVVQKTTNRDKVFFGSYNSEKDAQRIVEELKKCNWDKSQLPAIKERVLNGNTD